ncbi:MAG: Fic family protein [Proteobacteria bacterium]|nr:Fic family protein [Pseudomonadota bacterium]
MQPYAADAQVCTKWDRLCDRIDVDLLTSFHSERHTPIKLIDVQDAARRITANIAEFRSNILRREYDKPDKGPNGYKSIEAINRKIFQGCGLLSLGRFREGDETVFIDRGQHQFSGVAPKNIRDELAKAWVETMHRLDQADTKREIAVALAFLMVQVFRIHPFFDGNGRTTRLALEQIAASKGWEVQPFSKSANDRRGYQRALRYAHRRRLKRDGYPNDQDCILVSNYIEQHLARPLADEVEEEPTDLVDDRMVNQPSAARRS